MSNNDTLGDYQILNKIGNGSEGTLYSATYLSNEELKYAAIKIYNTGDDDLENM